MKLDRDENKNHEGKYALIKLRVLRGSAPPYDIVDAFKTLGNHGLVDYGNDPDTEFFVIRLRDKHAAPALAAYALSAYQDDPEYGLAVLNLAKQAAEHPNKKQPD